MKNLIVLVITTIILFSGCSQRESNVFYFKCTDGNIVKKPKEDTMDIATNMLIQRIVYELDSTDATLQECVNENFKEYERVYGETILETATRLEAEEQEKESYKSI